MIETGKALIHASARLPKAGEVIAEFEDGAILSGLTVEQWLSFAGG